MTRSGRQRAKREPRLRRAHALVVYWDRGRLIFENYRARVRVTAAPLAVQVLDFFQKWRPSSEFYACFSEYSRSSLQQSLRQLLRFQLLVREGTKEAGQDERAKQAWGPWSPAAPLLHLSSRDQKYVHDLGQARRLLRRHAKKWPMPPPVKSYPRAPKFLLPAPHSKGEFSQVVLARRTWRKFSSRPLSLSNLSTLLALTWGVQRWVEIPGLGRIALKTSPSAGARHPIEVYVLALRVKGLPRGLYHYAAGVHKLELLRRGSSARQAVEYLAGQWYYGPAAAVMLMTAVFHRNQWKYRDPGAYRTVLVDAGHVCQTFCLVATWLGLAPFCTMALADSRVEKDLGVDGFGESVLYAAGVGVPPPGADWAPWPSRHSMVAHASGLL